MADSIYYGTITTRVTTPCNSIERFTGKGYLRVGPVRDATIDQNPFYLALALDAPNVKLNIASTGPKQYWDLSATSQSDGYNIGGMIDQTDDDAGLNRILAITADPGSSKMLKRDFCGKPQIFASFPTGPATISGPITQNNANVAFSLHTHAVHEDPNMQSQFYVQFVGDWDNTSAKLDITQLNKPNWPIKGQDASQSKFPTVTVPDPSAGSLPASITAAASAFATSSRGPNSSATISPSPSAAGGPKLKGLSTGPVIGILFGALFVLVGAFLLGRWALLRHRRNQKIKKASSIPAAGSAAPAFTPSMSYGYNTLHDAEAGDMGRRSVSQEPMLKSVKVDAAEPEAPQPYGTGPHLPEEFSDQTSPRQNARGNRDDPFADDADDADVPRISVSHHRGQ